MSMTDAPIARQIATYFGIAPDGDASRDIEIISAFTPGAGWDHVNPRVASVEACARLGRNGATGVTVRFDGRLADFDLAEVTR